MMNEDGVHLCRIFMRFWRSGKFTRRGALSKSTLSMEKVAHYSQIDPLQRTFLRMLLLSLSCIYRLSHYKQYT